MNRAQKPIAPLRDACAVIGVVALAWGAFDTVRSTLPQLQAAQPDAAQVVPVMPSARTADPRRRALTEYLSKRFRIARDATEEVVAASFDAGRQLGLDPLVILSVIAVESSFNPFSESEMGAKGLMQVIPKHHAQLLREIGGEHWMLDPITNVHLGAKILKSYVTLTGSVEDGLQFYNGASSDLKYAYAQKVIAGRERLLAVLGQSRRPQPGST